VSSLRSSATQQSGVHFERRHRRHGQSVEPQATQGRTTYQGSRSRIALSAALQARHIARQVQIARDLLDRLAWTKCSRRMRPIVSTTSIPTARFAPKRAAEQTGNQGVTGLKAKVALEALREQATMNDLAQRQSSVSSSSCSAPFKAFRSRLPPTKPVVLNSGATSPALPGWPWKFDVFWGPPRLFPLWADKHTKG